MAVTEANPTSTPISQHTCASLQTGTEQGNRKQEVTKDPYNSLLGYLQIILISNQGTEHCIIT